MDINIDWLKEQVKKQKFRKLIALLCVTGVLMAVEFCFLSYSILKIIRYLILLIFMFLIAWIDQHERKIPNRLLKWLLLIRGILLVAEWFAYSGAGMVIFLSSLLGMLIGGGLFLLAHFVSRGGVGMGDVKLFAVIGAYMGSGSIMGVIFLTAVLSALYSLVMLVRKKIKLKEEIPFAPFILVGLILAMALGI